MGINDLYGSLRVWGQGDNDSYTGFSVVHSGTGIADFIVRSGGKIGMGTSLPDWDLELFRDGASSEAAIVSDGGDAILNFQTRNETDSYIVHRKGDIGVGNAIWAAGVDFSNGTGSYNTYTIATGTTFAQDHQLVITSGGTVGIRKLAPLATLDIAGDLMVRDVAVGGDYNLIWDSTTNSVKRGNDIIPVNLTGATFLVSGYTTGCTTFLVYSSNTGHQTFSANTCEDFGPYRYGKALQSIEPKLGANQANAKYSVIGGGRHNIVMSGINSEDNVIAAGNSNIIQGGFTSSGIFAGKQNKIVAGSNDQHNVIAGGILNTISGESYSSILGSTSSKIIATVRVPSYYSAIVGGSNHFLHGSAYGAIVGGINSVMSGSLQSVIVGGTANKFKYSTASFIGGGGVNVISGSTRSAILGGTQNEISASTYSAIVGGNNNDLDGSESSVIVGGTLNRVHENSDVVIVGGSGNTIEKTAISSAIIGASQLTAMSAQTTYLRGLNVNSDVAGNTPNGNWLQYHGINADQGLGRVLVSHDNDGHAKWKNLANLIPSGITSFSGSDVYMLTAYTSGCTWYGVTNSGTTLTADTCSNAGPYKFGIGTNSIMPVLGLNQTTGLYGNVQGGSMNNNFETYTNILGGSSNAALNSTNGGYNLMFGVGNITFGGKHGFFMGQGNLRLSSGNFSSLLGQSNNIIGGVGAGEHSHLKGLSNLEISSSGNTIFGITNFVYNSSWNNIHGHHNNLNSATTFSHVSGTRNYVGGAKFATILSSSGSTVLADGGHILGGTGNTIFNTASSSAILGGNAITARTSQTTYTHGLNVWTDTGDGDRPFHYHGGAANNIIIPNSPAYSGSPNVFLAGVNADGRARWAPVPGSVQPQFMSGDSYVVSAHTIGCTLYLYTNSGTTVTADTCNNFLSPYKWAGPINSWNPTSPGGPNENVITSEWSQILGGGDMLSGGTIGSTNLIRPKDKFWAGGSNASVYIGNTVVGGTGNHILSGSISTIISGAWNKISGQFGFSTASGGRAGGVGNVIAGGYGNAISGWTANLIGTGVNNRIKSGATSYGTILNGYYNTIDTKGGLKESQNNQILNGQNQTITSYQPKSNSIINGNTNNIIGRTNTVQMVPGADPVRTSTQNSYNTIVNGNQNLIVITANSISNIQQYNTILNGSLNSASTLSQYSTILGGQKNLINGNSSSVLAGRNNHITGNNSAVLAGYNHHIAPSAVNSSILAGQDIFAYSADTSYTNLLNVQSAMTSTTLTQILVRELDPNKPGGFGAIKVKDFQDFKTSSSSRSSTTSGGLISGNTQVLGVLSACSLVTANITACGATGEGPDGTNIILASTTQITSGLAVTPQRLSFIPSAALSIEASDLQPALSAACKNSVVAHFLGRSNVGAGLVVKSTSENINPLYNLAQIKLSPSGIAVGHGSYTPFGIFTGSSTNQTLTISGDSVMVGTPSGFGGYESNQDFSSRLTINNNGTTKDSLRIQGTPEGDEKGSELLIARFRNASTPTQFEVTGNTILDGALRVSGVTSFSEDSKFNKNVTINGGLTITATTYPGTPLFRADDNIVVIWPYSVGFGRVPVTFSGTTNISGDTTVDGVLTLNSGLKGGGEDGKLDVIGGITATFLTGNTVSATSVHASSYITLGGKSTIESEEGKTKFGDSEIISEVKGTKLVLKATIGNVELNTPDDRGISISNGWITGSTVYSANTQGSGSIKIPSPSSTLSSGSTEMGLARKYTTDHFNTFILGVGSSIYVTHNLNSRDVLISLIGSTDGASGDMKLLGDASVTITIMNYNTIRIIGVVSVEKLRVVVMTI